MATQTVAQAQAQAIKAPLADMGQKAMEATSAYAKANQRILTELVNLSSAAMQEAVRVYGELGTAALDAVRTAPGFPFPTPSAEELTKDPTAGFRQTALAAGDGPQRLLKLFDDQVQILGHGAQRFQASAERTGKEIREAVTTYFNRIGEIYGAR